MFIYKIFNKYNLYRQNYFLFFCFVLIPEHELQDQHQKKLSTLKIYDVMGGKPCV
jgi:hypothetical protein